LLGSELLGFIGGALATSGFIPQVVRVLKLKSAYEISLSFSFFLLLGTACWLTYGILLDLMAVIFWNSILLALVIVLIYAKLRYGGKKT